MKFEPIAYASHHGGRCRGCADENGVCPTSGLPCDPDLRLKAAAHCLKAWQYGIEHGFTDNPFPRGAATDTETLHVAAKEVIASASDTYKKRNGHLGSFEDDSGEKCWIVPFDAFESLRSAVDTLQANCCRLDVHPGQHAQQHAAEKNGQSVPGDPHEPGPLSDCEQALCAIAAEESRPVASTAKGAKDNG